MVILLYLLAPSIGAACLVERSTTPAKPDIIKLKSEQPQTRPQSNLIKNILPLLGKSHTPGIISPTVWPSSGPPRPLLGPVLGRARWTA